MGKESYKALLEEICSLMDEQKAVAKIVELLKNLGVLTHGNYMGFPWLGVYKYRPKVRGKVEKYGWIKVFVPVVKLENGKAVFHHDIGDPAEFLLAEVKKAKEKAAKVKEILV